MYIDRVPNRASPPAVLLRQSYRQDGRVRKRTLANLSDWPPEKIEALRAVLRGDALVQRAGAPPLEDAFEIVRSLPHGHVAAALGTLRRLDLDTLIDPRRSRERDLVVAMIVARLIEPRSKLATAQGLSPETLHSSLGEALGLESADEDDLYAALDWLRARQARIEQKLAAGRLRDGSLVFYDLSSTYFEGRHCPLARLGHSRDGKRDKLQIVFGLLCDSEGCPVAVEVFEGNTSDPATLLSQVRKLRDRFGLRRLILVGDRGMITEARICEDLGGVEGLDWITALRAPAIRKLVEEGSLQLSLFDKKDLGEIESPDYPYERLVVCRNPLLAEERARKREDLLAATEKQLRKIADATSRARRPLRGKDKIGMRVGRVLHRFKMGKHFRVRIRDRSFTFERRADNIASEAALDGFYVLRTCVPARDLGAPDVVRSYKRLSHVERAFRSLKSVDLKVRPIHHRLADRVRAHVFLCMLAYYVEWHMRRALAPVLFDDDDRAAAEARRTSEVAPARRSARAEAKARRKRTEDGAPVSSFQGVLRDLATLTRNHVRPKIAGAPEFVKLATPTPHQQRMLDLLGVSPNL